MLGLVTHIQRFCLHDGPGIRTTVFLKGCNMRCRWCHNPESIRPEAQLQLSPEKCIDCHQCAEACARGAIVATDRGVVTNRDLCVACGACAAVCYAGARLVVGQPYSPQQVLAEVLEDRAFYASSGGGVTLSGGEPLYQRDFCIEILCRCKAQHIHTAVESSIAWPWNHITPLLPLTDLMMIDIKMMDDALHRQWTGVSNRMILENARQLAQTPVALIVRTPLIGGMNDSVAGIGSIARFVSSFRNLLYYELLPYHPLGTGKYRGLGMEAPPASFHPPSRDQIQQLAAEARRYGIEVRIPDGT